ncbi:TIGR00730 family Rossman fold protein [Patescibacteria group bacterium]|nr:TIGR00730 family Rossman fold protein [Patescibacteria group bacterium]MBU1895738.1 TIGR00730 family Rossman fold protein [Patescibacteria group bacterium]
MKKETIDKIQRDSKEDFSYSINETGEYRESWRIFRIMAEFVEGYQFISQFEKEVTVMGSARLAEDTKYYNIARNLGKLLAENDLTTITGGGPGIMEAANRGAFEAGGQSVGLNIQLPFEQRVNPYVKKSTAFYYFFTRKVMLTAPADAFVFFPGGFGTMDEFFEVVDMIELRKMAKVPIILIDKEFWQPLFDFLHQGPVASGFFSEDDISEWHLVDTAEEAMKIINSSDQEKNESKHPTDMDYQLKKQLDWKIFRIMAELVEGFEFLTGLVEDVTVLGTKSLKPNDPYYDASYRLGKLLANDNFTVVTGGSSGVAEAANKGALEVGGKSLGIAMTVGGKTRVNPYVSKSIVFQFPFVRKVIITAPSKGFVVFPGGLGTMHQLFEILTLIQTKKMQKIPVILYSHKFWQPLQEFIKKKLVHDLKTIGDEDDELFQIVDDVETAVDLINKSRKA